MNPKLVLWNNQEEESQEKPEPMSIIVRNHIRFLLVLLGLNNVLAAGHCTESKGAGGKHDRLVLTGLGENTRLFFLIPNHFFFFHVMEAQMSFSVSRSCSFR